LLSTLNHTLRSYTLPVHAIKHVLGLCSACKVRVGVGVRVKVRAQGDWVPLAPSHRIAGHLRGCREDTDGGAQHH
jgi:hypothetical protein